MPDWRLPGEIQRDGAAFTKLMHALFGLYAYEPITHVPFPWLVGAHIFVRYEWFLSLDFDWDFLTGAKRFRWPMVSGFNPWYPICSQHLHYTDLLLRQPISPVLCNDRNVSLLNFLSSLSLISVCIQCCCS